MATLVALIWLPLPTFAGHGAGGPVLTEYPERVRRLLETGQPVVLLDVRPLEAYRKGHVPGARSLPRAELDARAHEMSEGTPLILYADSMFEARRAHDVLRGLGFRNLRILEGGLDGWVRRGWPLEPAP
jgi:rhodanese-related sulfurtransferase